MAWEVVPRSAAFLPTAPPRPSRVGRNAASRLNPPPHQPAVDVHPTLPQGHHLGIAGWLAVGSVPGALGGVALLEWLHLEDDLVLAIALSHWF
jgi:hypothetical protein